jgi:hypothetical protein
VVSAVASVWLVFAIARIRRLSAKRFRSLLARVCSPLRRLFHPLKQHQRPAEVVAHAGGLVEALENVYNLNKKSADLHAQVSAAMQSVIDLKESARAIVKGRDAIG